MDPLRLSDPGACPGAAGEAPSHVRAAAEQAARTSYGRLLSILVARTRDIELAEDALGDAFLRALRSWPETGVPRNPAGWLLTVARNRLRDLLGSAAERRRTALDELRDLAVDPTESAAATIPDDRLALLLVCAHPAIDPAVRAPLMLQTVLGVEAARIARVFAVPPATMAQRLVRAKRRIRDARIPFHVPDRARMTQRLPTVLEAIYGAYAIDWQDGPASGDSLASEALYLAETAAVLMDGDPEALGLAALIALSLARAPARGSEDAYVPLEEQEVSLWDDALIARGEAYLRRASRAGCMGRFQLEAAIQSVHCARRVTGETDWHALRRLYQALVEIAPTLGARVALAVASGRIDGPDAGIERLDRIRDRAAGWFQPGWAARAHLLTRAGRRAEAVEAYRRAITLTTSPGARSYLEQRLRQLGAAGPG